MRIASPSVDLVADHSRRGGIALAAVLVFCVLVLSAQAPARKRRGSLLQSWILSATAPVASAGSLLSRAVSGATDGVEEVFRARGENTRLKKELAAKDRELFRLRAEASQAAREGRLSAGAAALPRVVTTAPILLFENRAGLYSVLIGAGSADGVRVGAPIAVAEGLVGRVVTVGRTVSRAQLLLDASAAVGARVAGTGELGIVRGSGRGDLRLNNLPMASHVRPGDLVESAGIDGIYPRGVAIGRVASVAKGSNLFLDIHVTPSAAFSQLTDVLVLAPSPAGESANGGP